MRHSHLTRLALALAAALVAKVARLSRETWPDAGGAAAQAVVLRERALRLAQVDAAVYGEALNLLEAVPDEPRGRSRDHELGRALARAAAVPAMIVEAAVDVATLARVAAERGSEGVRADALGAAALAAGAARSGALLVEVNLGATEDDPRVHGARALAAAAAALAGREPAREP